MMDDLFEIVTSKAEKDGKVSVGLGVRVRLATHETLCPITPPCDSYEAFERASQALVDGLTRLRREARALFENRSSRRELPIGPDTPAQEIWKVLSTMPDEADWAAAFNDLGEAQRRAVADHILTHCSIFSGKALVFSRRYNSEKNLIEPD